MTWGSSDGRHQAGFADPWGALQQDWAPGELQGPEYSLGIQARGSGVKTVTGRVVACVVGAWMK